MNQKELSIVIPCLNEEKTISVVVTKALNSLKRLGIDGEVIVSDNGSTDNSVKIAEKLGAQIINCSQKGYGNALICGLKKACGKYLLMGDADDSYNFDEIDDFIFNLREGYDVVIGTRLKGKIEKGAMPFLHRYFGTPVLTFILNLLFKTKISDCNCGMRGISKEVFNKLNLSSAGMEFASEMIIKAGILKLSIKEIPITLYLDKRERGPHLNTWRDGYRNLKFMLLYSPNFVFIWPAVLFFTIGTLLMILQINGPFEYMRIRMDIHSFIFGLTLSIVGISFFQMGLIIKLYSHLNYYYTSDPLVNILKRFTLENGLIIGSLILLLGIIIDATILIQWINNGFKDIQLSRLAIFGLYFIFIGSSFVSFSFLRAIMQEE